MTSGVPKLRSDELLAVTGIHTSEVRLDLGCLTYFKHNNNMYATVPLIWFKKRMRRDNPAEGLKKSRAL
jgi:hypothetical protein